MGLIITEEEKKSIRGMYLLNENRTIPHLTELLKSLVFKDFDLDFKLTHKGLFGYNSYFLKIYLDPEVMCMSGDMYDSDAIDFLDNVEENIHGVLPYVGLSDSELMLEFEFLNDKEFSNKLVGMVNGIFPTLYDRIEDLPKLVNMKSNQNGGKPEFKISFRFDNRPKMGQIQRMYEYIHELLPTFEDVYLDFGVI